MEKLKNKKNNGLQSFSPSTPQLFKDSAIREMLRRRHAAVPPLSDSFEEKLFAAYEQRHRSHKSGVPMPNRPLTVRRFLWPSIAAAAVGVLLLTFSQSAPVATVNNGTRVETPLIASATPVRNAVKVSSVAKKEKSEATDVPAIKARHTKTVRNIPEKITMSSNPAVSPQDSLEAVPSAEKQDVPPVVPLVAPARNNLSLSARGEDMRRRMDEKFNEVASIITKVKEEKV